MAKSSLGSSQPRMIGVVWNGHWHDVDVQCDGCISLHPLKVARWKYHSGSSTPLLLQPFEINMISLYDLALQCEVLFSPITFRCKSRSVTFSANVCLPTAQPLIMRACWNEYGHFMSGDIVSSALLFSMYPTKFDAKKTKITANYMTNMIMNVSETVCQFIHYFHRKKRSVINLPWPTVKSKQHPCIEHFDIISWPVCILICWHLRLLQSV